MEMCHTIASQPLTGRRQTVCESRRHWNKRCLEEEKWQFSLATGTVRLVEWLKVARLVKGNDMQIRPKVPYIQEGPSTVKMATTTTVTSYFNWSVKLPRYESRRPFISSQRRVLCFITGIHSSKNKIEIIDGFSNGSIESALSGRAWTGPPRLVLDLDVDAPSITSIWSESPPGFHTNKLLVLYQQLVGSLVVTLSFRMTLGSRRRSHRHLFAVRKLTIGCRPSQPSLFSLLVLQSNEMRPGSLWPDFQVLSNLPSS